MNKEQNRESRENGLKDFHALKAEEVAEHLKTDPKKGLSTDEAKERLEEHGENRLEAGPDRSALSRYLEQFKNLLILILIGAAVIAALIGEWVDSLVIVAVVLIITFIGFIQEGKAEKAIESIKKMLSQKASVLRDEKKQSIPAEKVVPGDILFLQSGDKVPADLRLMTVKNLQVDEAALTGESVPVEKDPEPTDEDADLGDRKSMTYSGTVVTKGNATGIVVATGEKSELGKISSMVSEAESLKTPLLRQMDEFGRHLSIVIVGFAALTFAIGYFVQDMEAGEILMAAVSLIVAAIPEGLPAIMTITLAIGVQAMAKRHAIIRKLPAVETLGSVNVICADKTGTLTRNEMTVRKVITASHVMEVGGTGYDPHGDFKIDEKEVDPKEHSDLVQLIRAGVLCNDSSLKKENEEWIVEGDPTEGALLALGKKAGMDPEEESKNFSQRDVIPFSSENKFMATLNHSHEGKNIIFLKGAPEKVLELCKSEDQHFWEEQTEKLASEGHRALFLASKEVPEGKDELDFSDVEGDMTLLGTVGMIDPPREEAIQAVSDCHAAGIDVKMITGDHVLTAQSIGRQMEIGKDKEAVSGKQVEKAEGEELKKMVVDSDVFARTSPEQKVKLVKALQEQGKVVAMTGDGVNDAPSLQQANIGVAMGQRGTEASKEASEMVLTDDNFVSIADAVREGRAVYDNLKKAIFFMLPTNAGQALIIFLALVLGTTLPLLPLQVLWVNMVTTVTLAVSLAFEPAESDIMERPPRASDAPIFSRFLIWRIAFVSILLVLGSFAHFYWALQYDNISIDAARTIAINTLVVGQVFYLMNSRFLLNPTFNRKGIFGSRAIGFSIAALVMLQALFTYFGPMQSVFETTAFPSIAWIGILTFGVLLYTLVEIEKTFIRKRSAKRLTKA
jgi:magnesium-transporting ATPase (P-type)